MDIAQTTEAGAVVAVINGRIDSNTAASFEKQLKDIGAGATSLVADFSGVDYVSSAGLRAVLSVHKFMSAKKGFALRNVRENIRELLEMTGLIELLTVH